MRLARDHAQRERAALGVGENSLRRAQDQPPEQCVARGLGVITPCAPAVVAIALAEKMADPGRALQLYKAGLLSEHGGSRDFTEQSPT